MSKKLYAFYIKNPSAYKFYDILSDIMNCEFTKPITLYGWTTDKWIKTYFMKSRNMDIYYLIERDISNLTEEEFDKWLDMYGEYKIVKHELRHNTDDIFIPCIGPEFEYNIFLSALPFLYEYLVTYSSNYYFMFDDMSEYDNIYNYIDTLKPQYRSALYNLRVDLLIEVEDIYSTNPILAEYLDEYNIYKFVFDELYEKGVLE